MYSIKIDLYNDWVKSLRSDLCTWGYSVTHSKDEEVIHIYLNLLKRLVEPKPRKIFKSKEFKCPKSLLSGLLKVEEIIENGDNIKPYLSRLLLMAEYDDPLLNHWGIHHIHLGKKIESDGFIERTGPLLFCRFDNTNAYFINVLPHGSWSKQDMIRTLHNNWPESIRQFRLKGNVSLTKPITDRHVNKLRNGNVNTVVEIEEGVIYAPIGGGVSTSGISVDLVRQGNYCVKRLGAMQQAVIDNISA